MYNFSAQKAALTKALKVGTTDAVENATRRVVIEWDQDGAPDDWSRWNRALADVGSWETVDSLMDEILG